MIEIITASHREHVLAANLEQSMIVIKYPLAVMRGYTNIAQAYNHATRPGKINIYVHHDVWLPPQFEQDLAEALNNAPPDWGVMGLAGVRWEDNRRRQVGHILDRGREWGAPITGFDPVDTLDELILITKGDFTFDEQFEQDYYGADICMQAKQMGRASYVFKGYCEHNSARVMGGRTPGFFESQKKFKQKWRDWLPIATTCSLLTA